MTKHYLVIWLKDKDMKFREETPVDLQIVNPETDDAERRYTAIIDAISRNFGIHPDRVSIINICRL